MDQACTNMYNYYDVIWSGKTGYHIVKCNSEREGLYFIVTLMETPNVKYAQVWLGNILVHSMYRKEK